MQKNIKLSFKGSKVRTYAYYTFLVAGFFLAIGLILGFILLLAVSGGLNLDITLLLKYHIYFVLGFIYLIILGASSVLIPMFSLSHNNSFRFYWLSFYSFLVAGVIFLKLFIFLSVVFFIIEIFIILKNRARKAKDYWNINIVMSLLFLIIGVFFYLIQNKDFVFILFYGFLYAFIVAHLYKIAPFLVWYHYISPFVGKMKLPLLEDMILKNLAYISLWLNLACVLFKILKFEALSIVTLFGSILLVIINIINVFKYTKFGENNEQN